MSAQRPIDLNPRAEEFEAVKLNWPPAYSRRRVWTFEVMRFIPHDGMARR